MTVRQESALLCAALGALGLAVRSRNSISIVCDSDGRRYAGFRDEDLEGDSHAPRSLTGFLKVRYFEHYGFPNDYKVIHNPFCGMSREELELKLAVMGK
jgi:hypothetical protein